MKHWTTRRQPYTLTASSSLQYASWTPANTWDFDCDVGRWLLCTTGAGSDGWSFAIDIVRFDVKRNQRVGATGEWQWRGRIKTRQWSARCRGLLQRIWLYLDPTHWHPGEPSTFRTKSVSFIASWWKLSVSDTQCTEYLTSVPSSSGRANEQCGPRFSPPPVGLRKFTLQYVHTAY